MRKRLSLLLAVAALGVGATAPTAYGEPMRVAQEETDDAEDDGGSDYGWIGLLGLAGLAGLLGRRRDDVDRDRLRTRNTGTATTRDTEPRP